MNKRQTLKIASTLFLAIALISAVFISGCAEQDDDTLSKVTFGYQPSTHQMAYFTAMDKGWWAEDLAPYGVETVDGRLFPTGAPEMQAMLAGHIDVAYVGAAPFISALAGGLDAKIVAAVQTQGSDIVLRTGLPYESPDDLKGLRIATFPAGTIQDTILRNWLEENGIDPERDVNIVGMGPGDAMTAIKAGQVDAVFLPHPAPALLESDNAGRSVVLSGELLQDHACCVLVVSGDLINNHPEIVQQIVATHIRATEYNSQNMEEAAQIYADDQEWDVAIIKKSLEEWDGEWIADPNLIVDSTVSYSQVQYDLGYINALLTKDDIFDLSFYEALDQ